MGSRTDLEHAEKIKEELFNHSIECELRIASAHRTPEYLIRILQEYHLSGDQIVIITVAGLSDALSGMVAAQRIFPVIACPPDIERYQYAKVFSSAFTPADVPVALVVEPGKVANFVAQIFALTNKDIAKSISSALDAKKANIINADKELRNE